MDSKEQLYLSDIPVSSRSQDRFQFAQISDLILRSIEYTGLPVHIGLMGPWGSGKTSALCLLEESINAQTTQMRDYKIKFISVWKFADDAPSLHRRIVREVQRILEIKNNEGIDTETLNQNSFQASGGIATASSFFQKTFNKWEQKYLHLTIFFIISTMLTGIYAINNNSSLATLLTVVGWLILSRNTVQKTEQITTKALPLQHGDQYEVRFKDAVRKYLKHNKGTRLILVFDDLDRLPPNQMVAALNTIKTFLFSKECAFIIPCDETVLRAGVFSYFDKLNLKPEQSLDGVVNEFLTKNFDLLLRLPNIEQSNMKRYAKNTLKEQNITWANDKDIPLDRVLGILIHSGVKTPRQVKNILNAFAFDWNLAKSRDSRAGKTLLTANPITVAIFTILKTEFPEFWSKFAKNPFILNKENETNLDDDPLLNGFLSRIGHLLPSDPRPFIYFSNEELNPITGKPHIEETKQFVINAQGEKFKASYTQLSDEDRNLVLSAVLADIDEDEGVEAENALRVLVDTEVALPYISEIELNRWENLIRENILIMSELPLEKACFALTRLGEHAATWQMFGQSLEVESKLEELVSVWKSHPEWMNKLSIQDLPSQLIEGFIKKEKGYLLAEQLIDLPNNHEMLEEFDWVHLMEQSSEGGLLPHFNFANWINEIISKLADESIHSKINCSWITSMLNKFDSEPNNYTDIVMGIGDVWLSLYAIKKESIEGFTKLLVFLTSHPLFEGFNKENYQRIAEIIKTFEPQSISTPVQELLTALWKVDKSIGLERIRQWDGCPGVADFCFDQLNEGLEPNYIELFTRIVVKGSFETTKITQLVATLNNNIVSSASSNQISWAIPIVTGLISSEVFRKNLLPYMSQWFSEHFIWLNWVETVVRDRIVLYGLFCKEDNQWQEWLKQSINNLAIHVRLGTFPGRTYQGNIRSYLNIIIETSVKNNFFDDWEIVVNQWASLSANNITYSLVELLDSPVRYNILLGLHKACLMNCSTFNSWLVTYFEPSNGLIDAVVERWEHLTEAERKTFFEKISSADQENKLHFEKMLLEWFIYHPLTKMIDEVSAWNTSESTKEAFCKAIVKSMSKNDLNRWVREALDDLNQSGINKWVIVAIKSSLETRNDIELPLEHILQTSLGLKDERAELALRFLLMPSVNKSKIGPYKDLLQMLNPLYPDLVNEIKQRYKIRFNKVRFSIN